MECQVEKNEHFRHLLLFAFNQGSKTAKAARDIWEVLSAVLSRFDTNGFPPLSISFKCYARSFVQY